MRGVQVQLQISGGRNCTPRFTAMYTSTSLLGFMRGGLIDYLRSGVKATYIPLFATMRGSYNPVLQHFPAVLKYFQGLAPLRSSQIVARFGPRLWEDYLAVGQIVVPAPGFGLSIPLQRRSVCNRHRIRTNLVVCTPGALTPFPRGLQGL